MRNLKIHFLCLKPFFFKYLSSLYTEIGFLYLHIVRYEKFYTYIADRLASLNYCFNAQYIKL